ncbi:MAG: rhomboid family intramembrane serine protease [Campylobacterota bacterium]|nr:rhomboid family intramembrane serine protease [Campylobacterota bacterium]
MMQNNKIFTLTNIIILINIIMFGIQNNIEYGDVYLGLNIYFFRNEFYYQLLSTMFVHGGVAHILMNMFVLYQFGNMIEQYLGKFKYLLLYFIGGILTSIGSLAYMYFTGDWVNLVGASGAISVLLGWFALKDKYQRKGIIIWVLLISFAPLLLGLPVAWYAHLIGFALGWLLGYIL